jgi:hypothetical protein
MVRRAAIGGTRGGLLRRGLLVLVAAGSVVVLLPGPAQTALATSPRCGTVLLAGTSWLGGKGVDVVSNGVDQGTGKQCSREPSRVGAVVAGERWQCVELVNRLYLTRRWITSAWNGDGGDLFRTAPSNLTKQLNGSITSVSPGDVVSIRIRHKGKLRPHGHVAVVNTPGTVTSGTIPLVNQNGGSRANVLVMAYATLANGTLTLAGGSGWAYTVIGVVHAPS